MKTLLILIALTHAADAGTTHYALTHGFRETLITPTPWVNDVILGDMATAQILGLRKLQHTHPKIAWTLAAASVSIRGYVVYHNLQTIRRR